MAKKFFAFILVLVLILTGCKGHTAPGSNNSNVTDNTDTSVTDTDTNTDNGLDATEGIVTYTDTIDEELSVNLDRFTESSSIDYYRWDVSHRFEENIPFLTDEEKSVVEMSGFKCFDTYVTRQNQTTLSIYYYPVVYREGDGLFMWYTTEYGRVYYMEVFPKVSSDYHYGGELHLKETEDDEDEEDEEIGRFLRSSVTYNPNTGKVSEWKFGKLSQTSYVPKNSTFVGHAFFDGFLFRQGSDVYAVQYMDGGALDTHVIAHGVQYVIASEYKQNSDAWCAPLFLMEDGEVKVYVCWESLGEEPDDPGHLLPIQYEGGYR